MADDKVGENWLRRMAERKAYGRLNHGAATGTRREYGACMLVDATAEATDADDSTGSRVNTNCATNPNQTRPCLPSR
jgi:hypothetical protein